MASTNADTSAGTAVPAVNDNTTAALPASLVQRPRAGTTAPAPPRERLVVEPTVLPQDEYHGKGGDYVIGADGIRRPATPEAPAA